MPTIELTDNAGLVITGSSRDDNATLNKYLDDALAFRLPAIDAAVKQALSGEVAQVDAGQFPLTVAAAAPASFKAGPATIGVTLEGSASIDVIAGDEARDFFKCFGASDAPAMHLASFGFTAGVEYGPTATADDVAFGLASEQNAGLTTYCIAAGTDKVLDAVKKAISGLTIPRDLDDLRSLPPGNICRIEGRGVLKFAASVEYSFVNNTLASVPLEAIPTSLSVKLQSGAKVQVGVEHTTGHALTIWRVSASKLRMSVSLSKGVDVSANVSVSFGVSATVAGEDALSFLVRQISPKPDEEMEQLKQAMPASARDDLSSDIAEVIEDATSGDVEASIASALEKSRAADRLLAYEVDLDALDAAGTGAVRAALRGDFRLLTEAHATLAGVREIANVLTETLKTTHTVTIHLIGILNFEDVSSFMQQSTAGLNDATGEMVLTAEEVKIVDNRIDTDHLREVLLRSAVITTGAATTAQRPDFTFKMVFFLQKAHPSDSDRIQALNALRTVGSADGNRPRGGALSLYLSLDLNKQLSLAAFQNRTTDDYIRAGQNAMKALLTGDRASQERLRLGSVDIGFWNSLREEGSRPNIERKLHNASITDPAAVVDFFAIDWWAQAMGKVAEALKTGRSLREGETAALKKTQGGFDLPWALIATYLLLDRNPHVDSKCSWGGRDVAHDAP